MALAALSMTEFLKDDETAEDGMVFTTVDGGCKISFVIVILARCQRFMFKGFKIQFSVLSYASRSWTVRFHLNKG